jgi:hypothetical protein
MSVSFGNAHTGKLGAINISTPESTHFFLKLSTTSYFSLTKFSKSK